MMKPLRFLAPTLICAVSVVIGTALPGLALRNNHSRNPTDLEILLGEGYDCKKIDIGGDIDPIECTRDDDDDVLWCTDSGSCSVVDVPAHRPRVSAPASLRRTETPGRTQGTYSF